MCPEYVSAQRLSRQGSDASLDGSSCSASSLETQSPAISACYPLHGPVSQGDLRAAVTVLASCTAPADDALPALFGGGSDESEMQELLQALLETGCSTLDITAAWLHNTRMAHEDVLATAAEAAAAASSPSQALNCCNTRSNKPTRRRAKAKSAAAAAAAAAVATSVTLSMSCASSASTGSSITGVFPSSSDPGASSPGGGLPPQSSQSPMTILPSASVMESVSSSSPPPRAPLPPRAVQVVRSSSPAAAPPRPPTLLSSLGGASALPRSASNNPLGAQNQQPLQQSTLQRTSSLQRNVATPLPPSQRLDLSRERKHSWSDLSMSASMGVNSRRSGSPLQNSYTLRGAATPHAALPPSRTHAASPVMPSSSPFAATALQSGAMELAAVSSSALTAASAAASLTSHATAPPSISHSFGYHHDRLPNLLSALNPATLAAATSSSNAASLPLAFAGCAESAPLLSTYDSVSAAAAQQAHIASLQQQLLLASLSAPVSGVPGLPLVSPLLATLPALQPLLNHTANVMPSGAAAAAATTSAAINATAVALLSGGPAAWEAALQVQAAAAAAATAAAQVHAQAMLMGLPAAAAVAAPFLNGGLPVMPPTLPPVGAVDSTAMLPSLDATVSLQAVLSLQQQALMLGLPPASTASLPTAATLFSPPPPLVQPPFNLPPTMPPLQQQPPLYDAQQAFAALQHLSASELAQLAPILWPQLHAPQTAGHNSDGGLWGGMAHLGSAGMQVF